MSKKSKDNFSWLDEPLEKRLYAKVAKVYEGLGLIIGFGIICSVDGDPYFDLQGDHIPDDSMLKAATDFMLHSRVAKEMHSDKEVGKVVFAWPLTADIAKAMGIKAKVTGLMIAVKSEDDSLVGKFADGTYTGFSIGGVRIEDEEVPNDE